MTTEFFRNSGRLADPTGPVWTPWQRKNSVTGPPAADLVSHYDGVTNGPGRVPPPDGERRAGTEREAGCPADPGGPGSAPSWYRRRGA